MTLGLLAYLQMPKIYESKALLSYEQQQINPAKMDPEQGRLRLREALATLQELVTSQSSLEKLMTQFSLYTQERERLPIQDVLTIIRKNIEIKPLAQGDVFSVSFQGSNPEIVVKMTNALASMFIEENLKYREERATETSKYTESELAMAKKALDAKEQVMRDYKLKNFNEMPEQRQSNIEQLQNLIKQQQGYQTSIQELERTKIMVQEQASMQMRLSAMQMAIETPGGSNMRLPESNGARLARLRTYLNGLMTKYTENHPEVVRTKQQIAQLEKQVASGQESVSETHTSQAPRTNFTAAMENQRLQLQVKEIDASLKDMRVQQAKLPAEIAKYQQWIAAAPVREAEWSALTRDYNEMRKHYDELVSQNLQAQSAENLERNQKGSKFKVVDPARLPEKPVKPNALRILLMAVAAGLGIGYGLILCLDFMDTSFQDVRELEEYIGIPVVCAVPRIAMPSEVKRETLVSRVSALLILGYGILFLIMVIVLWYNGFVII